MRNKRPSAHVRIGGTSLFEESPGKRRARYEVRVQAWVLVISVLMFAFGYFVGQAAAAPLSVRVHQDNLYGGTRAEVRVYTTIKASRPGMATIQVEPVDTRLDNWATEGPATTAHVGLHRGTNRIHRTLSVEMLEDRFCAWQEAFRADHPECPRLAGFRDPYVGVAVVFDKVYVDVSVAGRSVEARVGG